MTRKEALKKMNELCKTYNKLEGKLADLDVERLQLVNKENLLKNKIIDVRTEIERTQKEIMHPTNDRPQTVDIGVKTLIIRNVVKCMDCGLEHTGVNHICN